MEDILVELLAFSIIGVVIFAIGILWRIVSTMFGRDDPADDIHKPEEQHEDSKKD